jgi:hypothetical protein
MHASIIALAAAIALVPQDKGSDRMPKRGDAVIVRGCIDGGTVVSNDIQVRDSSASYAGEVTYRMSGDKKVVNPIKKEHNGHVDVLTGTLKSDLPDAHGSRGTRVGNTRIIIGAGPQNGPDAQRPPSLPVLVVKEIEHTGVSCKT